MVRADFRKMIALLLTVFTMLAPAGVHATGIQASLNEQQVELGKAVILTLRTADQRVSLDTINFEPLREYVHVDDTAETLRSDTGQIRNIRLFPRTTGDIHLPTLPYQSLAIQIQAIQVTQPRDSKDDSTIQVTTHVSEHTPWLKQQVLIRTEFISHSPILQIEPSSLFLTHSQVTPVPLYSEPVSVENTRLTRHVVGWVLHPLQAGKHRIDIPAIRLLRDGITTHRFYPPPIDLEVQDLPVYIPPSMSNGRLGFALDKPSFPVLISGNLYQLDFKLSGYVASLPDPGSFFSSNETIAYYPSTVTDETRITHHGLLRSEKHRIHFKARSQGIVKYPDITLRYFDPVTGKIIYLAKESGYALSISKWVLIPLLLALILITWKSCQFLFMRLSLCIRKRKSYTNILSCLNEANNEHEIRQVLNMIADTERRCSNTTIQQWYRNHADLLVNMLAEDLQPLEQALYHGKQIETENLKRQLGVFCQQQKKSIWLCVLKPAYPQGQRVTKSK